MKKISFRGSLLLIFLLAFSLHTSGQEGKGYLSFSAGMQQQDHINTLPERETLDGGDDFYQIGFNFSGAMVSGVVVNGIDYDFLHIEGFARMGQVGAPALPARSEVIAMPRGTAGSIIITGADYHEYDGFMIHPALEPARDTDGAPEPEFQIDEAVYGKDEFFPKNIVEITQIRMVRGNPLAVVQLRPVQFNPVSGKIRVYTNISYRIEYPGAEASFSQIAEGNSLHFTNLLKRSVINSDNIPDGMTRRESKDGEKEYIIITHNQYLTAANDLANWKRQLGYSVEVVAQASWTAAQVKSEIHTRYHAWTPKPDYFVIIGDHTGSFAVPGEIYQDPNYGDNFATDLYYACMDGATDWHPDMAHGRISVSSAAEAQVVVNKIINYEKTPPTPSSFYDNILNCAQYQDDDNNGYADRRFCHTSENIRDHLQDNYGYTSTRVYYTNTTANVTGLRYNNTYYSTGGLLPAELRSTSFNWSGGSSQITAEIDAGKFMVFHRDHGYVGGSGWHRPYYTTTSMNSLSNGDLLPVVFSINCHTGEFQLDNCFAEKFLRMENKGAVGMVAAAYYSYSGFNDALSIGMIDAIWADPGIYPVFGSGGTGSNYTIGAGNEIYTMGDVVNQGLYAMEQNWYGASSSHKYQYQLFHYFGDPAMKIWTENPNSSIITATHASTIDCALTSFSIAGSTPAALATLVFDNELIGETILDGSGNGTINYTITGSGTTVLLTISKLNHKPYTATLTLTGSCNPPAVQTDPATSITETTATLNGEILNDFGNTITESGFVYSTTPNPIIGGADVSQIQTAPLVTAGAFSENISGLNPSTTYYFKAYAVSAGGTGYGSNTAFSTSCGIITTLPYTQEFSGGGLPNCWQNIDHQGNGQVWQFNNPGGRAFNASSAGNGFAILDSDLYGNGHSQNADMVTPEFDLTGFTSVNLSFEHYYRAYSGSSGTLSYSVNGGSAWNTIQTWTATSANAAIFSQDMTAQVAGQSSVMFKWNYTGSWGYYWMVDDILITGVENTNVNQQISLTSGWNIMSFCVTPASTDMIDIVQPLIDNSSLVKVSDEAGGFVQEISGFGWMNTIGNMGNTEGYYINLNGNDNLDCEGSGVTLPFDIPLNSGWNIMGFPAGQQMDAMTVLQPLIDDGYLVKVLNESGGMIQYITGIGWINTIVNFLPGEGYHINVNTNCTLTLNAPSKAALPFNAPVKPKTEYFSTLGSNPFLPMNIIINNIQTDGMTVEEGDEIAVFDGKTEVGSIRIEDASEQYILIVARADDPFTPAIDGFSEGNMISFRYWDKSEDTEYQDVSFIHRFGTETYKRLGTFGADLKISSLGTNDPGERAGNFLAQNYPNPCGDNTTIEYGVAEDAMVMLSLYDVAGKLVRLIENDLKPGGSHAVTIGKNIMDAGIYYYKLEVHGTHTHFTETRKMIVY